MPYRVRSTDVWFNLPGVVAAYQPVACPAGPLLARANISNDQRRPGVYAAVSGVAPTFDPRLGWTFNGSTQYLDTGYVNPSTQQQAMIARFAGFSGTSDAYIAGSGNANGRYLGLTTALGGTNRLIFLSGFATTSAPGQAAGVVGVSLNRGYLNGVDVSTGNIADWTSTNTLSVYLGARNGGGSLIAPIAASIQAFLIADRALTPVEMALASRQMAWCHVNPDWNAWAPKRRYYWVAPPAPDPQTTEWRRISVEVGGADLTAFLYNREQTATLPDGPEVGRATLTLRYNPETDGIAIEDWNEVIIRAGVSSASVVVWGGYVTRRTYEPASDTGGGYSIVTLDCQSHAIRLVTTEPIEQSYDISLLGFTDDADVVANLVGTYLPSFYDATKIGGTSFVLDYIAFSGDNLRQALQKITNITQKEYGVTPLKKFYYRDYGGGTTYAYQLSDTPDEVTTYPMRGKPIYDVDALDRRNKIRVIGGWTYSDIIDDSFSGTGAQTVFALTYRPAMIINVTVAGVDQTVGIDFVDDPADFDCLVNFDTKTIKFTAAPGNLAPIHVYYRYNTRPDVTVADTASITAMGGTIWAPTLRDDSISGTADAYAAGSAYLAQFGTTLYRGQVTTVHSGTAGGTIVPWQPGANVVVNADAWGLGGATTMTIKGVTMRAEPRPGGEGYCLIHWDLDLGGRMTVGQNIAGEARNVDVTNRATFPAVMRTLTGFNPGE